MADVFKKALKLLVGSDVKLTRPVLKLPKIRPLKPLTERELIQLESQIGAEVFGEVPKGGRREFFNLNPTTWIWHEEWLDGAGKKQQATTRYEIQDDSVLKVQEGARYTQVEGQELQNLTMAIQMYYERVVREIYKRDPATGQKLN